ncbi:hypothetical protein KKC45_03280 [Patescibacteria group bacterium]|nr:hypothetical protein [Patescibacteria group bacterium]
MFRIVIQGLCGIDYFSGRLEKLKKEIESFVEIESLLLDLAEEDREVSFWCPCDPTNTNDDSIFISVDLFFDEPKTDFDTRKKISSEISETFRRVVSSEEWQKPLSYLMVTVKEPGSGEDAFCIYRRK